MLRHQVHACNRAVLDKAVLRNLFSKTCSTRVSGTLKDLIEVVDHTAIGVLEEGVGAV